MTNTKTPTSTVIKANAYTLEVTEKAISVILAGEQIALLCPSSAVNTVVDDTVTEDALEGALTFAEEKTEDGYTFTWTGKTKCWDKAEYVLCAKETHFEYFVRVYGKGDVDTVNYFIGDISAHTCGSEYEWDTGYMPIPTVDGASQCTFSAQKPYKEFSFLTVPPLFCYTFDICGMEPKMAFGLVADRGEHNFTQFNYDTKSADYLRRFWFYTNQDGHTHVDGCWTTPMIIGYGTASRKEALKTYADFYFDTGRADRKDPKEHKPRFWYGPMACGWIEQAAYQMKNSVPRGCLSMAYQPLYDNFNEELARRDLHPQIMIIDDKWQEQYGTDVVNTEQWPDLRGWIDRNVKENNRYTMLWYKLWDAEGIPDEMTMASDDKSWNGGRVVDPTNPKYREYLRDQLHRLVSSDEGCYNAYGLKLDYGFIQPVGRGAKSYSGKYGAELLCEYITLIHDIVKEFKPEAIVSASPCHPIFAKAVDHARLHDYYPDLRRCYEEFAFRQEIYGIAMPGVLFDTDGAAFTSRRDTMRHMTLSPKLGIPDLYCITPMPSLELTDDDWATIANVWREYGEKIDKMFE